MLLYVVLLVSLQAVDLGAQTLRPQVLDSLEHRLKEDASPSVKAEIYRILLESYRDRVPYRTLALSKDAEQFAKQHHNTSLLVVAQYSAGMALAKEGKDTLALQYFRSALSNAGEHKNVEQVAYINFLMSRIQRKFGNFTIALDLMLNAQKTLEKSIAEGSPTTFLSKEKILAEILEGVGYLYFLNKDYHRAIKNLHQSINLYNAIDTFLLTKPYSKLGNVYKALGQLDSAEWYCVQSLHIATVLTDKFGIAYGNRDYASILRLRGDYAHAFQRIQQAVALFKDINNVIGLAEAHYELAAIHFATKHYREALRAVDAALVYAENNAIQTVIYEGLQLKAQCYAAEGDFKRAYEVGVQYVLLRDSLYSNDMIRRNVEMQTRFEVSRKEQEIAQLQKESQSQAVLRVGLIIGVIAVVLVLLVVISRYQLKKKSEQELRVKNEYILRQQKELSAQARDIQEANEELHATIAELREVNERKGEFLSIAAHDLKNPLSAIKGYAELLLHEVVVEQDEHPDSPLVKDGLEFLPYIKNSAEHMVEIITELLNTETLESGKVELKKEVCDLYEIANLVVYGNKAQATAKDITLHATLQQECYTEADSRRIREVFDNIMSNAIKYSPTQKNVWITLAKNTTQVVPLIRFTVRDEGPGFTEDDKSKLFGKFQKLSARPTGGESSTGLGLSIVKTIVELHGGTISVESTHGHGAMFVVDLPITLPNDFAV